ncbi:MAG TPA: BTAD domain-containing putative transcriptional regulator [Solirubrobacterales bacterium]
MEARPALNGPGPWAPARDREDVRRLPLTDSPSRPEREPLRESPFGFVLTDGEGHVLSVNDRAATLLSADEETPGPRALTCCELVCGSLQGHGAPAGGSECLTRRAMQAGRALPEARVELRRNGAASVVWVTASPIDVAQARVVFYLRPDDPGDSTSRGAAVAQAPVAAPALRIRTLGTSRIESESADLGGEWLDQRPGQLLKYLICERHRVVTSDEIADALWPQAGPLTRNSVRHQVHVLRERLEPDRASRARSPFIVTRRGGYMLDPAQVWLDADQFEAEISAGLALLAQGDAAAGAIRLERGVALYEGDLFTENLYAEWALEERDRLRELAGRGLRALVEIARSAGDLETAASHARRLAAMEPFDMDVQREFIEICMRRGRRSEAMRRYAIVRKRCKREFGQDPDFTLGELRI